MGRLRERLALEAGVPREKLRRTERRESIVAVLLIAPVIAGVAWASLHYDGLSFVLFPPLAAVAYNLLAHPERPRNFPWQVPVTLTVGALSGAAAQNLARALGTVPQGSFEVDPVTAGATVLLAGSFLYLFDTEIAPALAVGLLLPFAGVPAGVYIQNVFLGSAAVAVAFSVWRATVHGIHAVGDGEERPASSAEAGDLPDGGEFVFDHGGD
jgi:hypothetical protein